MRETLKAGSSLTLENGARYFTEIDKLRANNLMFAHFFYERALSKNGSVKVKVTGFAFTGGFFIKIASQGDPTQEGWIRLAGASRPKVIAVEVDRDPSKLAP